MEDEEDKGESSIQHGQTQNQESQPWRGQNHKQVLHSEIGEPANQILQCGHQTEHLLFGLALKDGRSQLKLAHRQDVGLLTHLHCSLGQEDLQLRREKESVQIKRRTQKLSPPTGKARLWRRQPVPSVQPIAGSSRLQRGSKQQPLLLL